MEVENFMSQYFENLKRLEDITDVLNIQVDNMEIELNSLNDFKKDFDGNFNVNRRNLGILRSIQRDIDTENYIRELEETLEMVMQKYREHTQHKIQDTKLEFDKLRKSYNECKYTGMIESQATINEQLITTMHNLLDQANILAHKNTEQLVKVQTENKALRGILSTIQPKVEMRFGPNGNETFIFKKD